MKEENSNLYGVEVININLKFCAAGVKQPSALELHKIRMEKRKNMSLTGKVEPEDVKYYAAG